MNVFLVIKRICMGQASLVAADPGGVQQPPPPPKKKKFDRLSFLYPVLYQNAPKQCSDSTEREFKSLLCSRTLKGKFSSGTKF